MPVPVSIGITTADLALASLTAIGTAFTTLTSILLDVALAN